MISFLDKHPFNLFINIQKIDSIQCMSMANLRNINRIKAIFFIFSIILFSGCDNGSSTFIIADTPAAGQQWFISQSGTGSAKGNDLANSAAISTFNSGGLKYNPGDTVFFVGQFSDYIFPTRSGSQYGFIMLRGDYPGHEFSVDSSFGGNNSFIIRVRNDYISIVGFSAHIIDGSNASISGIWFENGVTHVSASNNNIAIDFPSGYSVYSCATCSAEIHNNTIASGQYGIRLEGSWNLVYNNIISNQTVAGISLSGADFNEIYDNAIYDCRFQGITIIDSDRNNIYQNSIQGIWNGLVYGAGGDGLGIALSGSSEHDKINHNYINNCHVGVSINTRSGGDNHIIYGNVVWDNRVNAISIYHDGGTWFNYIVNNTVNITGAADSIPSYVGHGIACQPGCNRAVIANNIIQSESSDPHSDGLYIGTSAETVQVKIDYNLYVSAVVDAILSDYNGHLSTQLDDLRASLAASASVTGLDDSSENAESHGKVDNPLFKNESGNEFSLLENSPCINAGTMLPGINDPSTSATDFAGTPIADIPDIGAFEYQQ